MILTRSLRDYLLRLYKSLLEKHTSSTNLIPSNDEEDSIKAFCVLAHAALEEYFETLAQNILQEAYNKYKSKVLISSVPKNQAEVDKINLGLIQLIETLVLASNFSTFSTQGSDTFKNHKSKLELATDIHKNGQNLTIQNISELTKKSKSYTKDLLSDTLKFFNSHIQSNHGASLTYLLRLLIPVGIDIPNDITLNSLQKLAKHRGDYAHTKGISQVLSVKDITEYVKDVIKLCFSIELGINRLN